MPSQSISDLLVATDELRALSARTRRLRELQSLYFRSAPRELVGSSRVKSFRAGTLCVSAHNGVAAAKLKQLAPTLLAALQKADAEIKAIRVEVQVQGGWVDRKRPREKARLSLDSIQEFSDLADRLPAGSLRSAVAGLVRRHRRSHSR
jgi:hypothetical protein